MTTKRIVYGRPGGGVSVICPSRSFIAAFDGTEDDAIAAILAKDVPADASNVEVLDVTALPSSREFRGAWEKPGPGAPMVNMGRARAIHAQRIGAAQRAETARLDQEERSARLNGKAAEANARASEKAAVDGLNLAAIGAQIAAANTPAELTAIWPLEIPRN